MNDKPCPLCGREMTAIDTYPGKVELYCGNCDLTIGSNEAKTPDELEALPLRGREREVNPYATCVILKGSKEPEEILFVHEDGSGVTHYRSERPESERVGRALLAYKDNPPTHEAGPLSGRWYELGDVHRIIMAPRTEYTTGELLTRLAELMGVRDEHADGSVRES